MRAALLTIGTEITSGEIVNRNAADIASRLEALNIDALFHISVPDDRNLMLSACQYVVDSVDLIIFTGGLGPTSDDFTREVIAEWAQKPLLFDKEVYKDLEVHLSQMGRQIKLGHKQQCFFPEGSILYANQVGHALAFKLELFGKILIALPGPPLEIASIWQNSIEPELKKRNIQPRQYLFKWKCLGKGESEFAEWAEEIFKDSGYTLGYRATVPYVYVKVWVPAELLDNKNNYFNKFEQIFSPYIVKRSFYEVLAEEISDMDEVIICDSATEGKILDQWLQSEKSGKAKVSYVHGTHRQQQDSSMQLSVEKVDGGRWKVASLWRGRRQETFVEAPYKMKVHSQRSQLYITEWAAKIWQEQIRELKK